jgi:hypothetical protein
MLSFAKIRWSQWNVFFEDIPGVKARQLAESLLPA